MFGLVVVLTHSCVCVCVCVFSRDKQVFISTVSTGSRGKILNSSFGNRDADDYKVKEMFFCGTIFTHTHARIHTHTYRMNWVIPFSRSTKLYETQTHS